MAGFRPGFGLGGMTHSLLVREPVKPGLGDMLVSVGLIGFGCMAGARAAMAGDGDGAMAADMVKVNVC